MGLKIEFGPAFSPWSKGINERNHYSVDMIVRKIRDEDSKIMLQDAVNMATWAHNTNFKVRRYTPLQLMTGKSDISNNFIR